MKNFGLDGERLEHDGVVGYETVYINIFRMLEFLVPNLLSGASNGNGNDVGIIWKSPVNVL